MELGLPSECAAVFSVRYNFNGSYYLFSCFRRGGLKGREMLTALF